GADALARAATLERQEALHRRGLLGLPSGRGVQRAGEARTDADQHREQDYPGLDAHLDLVSERMAAGDADAELLARRPRCRLRSAPRVAEAGRADGAASEAARAGSLRHRR